MLSLSDKFRKRRYGKVTTLSVAEGKNGRKEVYERNELGGSSIVAQILKLLAVSSMI